MIPRWQLNTWFLSLLLLGGSLVATAQSQLEARISLNAQNLPIADALYLVIDEGVKLTFNNGILPKEKRVTIKLVDEPVAEVLTRLLENTNLTFELVGSQIVILPFREPEVVQRRYTFSGFVSDAETGERIVNATVYDNRRGVGTYTNEFGHFSMTMLEGPATFIVLNLGYDADTIELVLRKNQQVQIALKPYFLTEVIVNSQSDSSVLDLPFGGFSFNIGLAKRLTSLAGETDVMRLAYAMPGIQTGADGFGGISVRGGNVDQNLFLLDGVPVYNATHGLGIYSIYNTGAVRSAKVLKGSFPAQYGGRLSSIWDIQTKEGNQNKVQGELEVGPSSLQLAMEGPFGKKRGSFFVSARRALFDFFSVPISEKLRAQNGVDGSLRYYFFDLNAKFNYRISDKDRLYLSAYRGKDDFLDIYNQSRWFDSTLTVLSKEEAVDWGNNVAALRWNHVASSKVFVNTSATFSHYYYKSEEFVDLDNLTNNQRLNRSVLLTQYKSNVKDIGLKTDVDWSAYRRHRFRFGVGIVKHRFQPGVINFQEATIIDTVRTLDTLGAYLKTPMISYEADVYVQDDFKLHDAITANIGIRGTGLWVDGYKYLVAQPRLLLQFLEGQRVSFNAGVSRNVQFQHLLSPTNIGLPKDLWVSATANVPPQRSWQFDFGTVYKFRPGIELLLDGYYKIMQDLVYFQGGGLNTINSTNWQQEVSIGKGWAYGTEALVKVETRRLSGWLGYAYARSERKFDEEVNNGNTFPIRLDRRHNFNLQTLYKLSKTWDFSLGFTWASGTAYTLATQQYEVVQDPNGGLPSNLTIVVRQVPGINERRLPPYHRLDFSFNHYFKVRSAQHTIRLGVYNAYFVKNPVYVTIRDNFKEGGKLKREYVQVSLLPFFPALRYIIEFR